MEHIRTQQEVHLHNATPFKLKAMLRYSGITLWLLFYLHRLRGLEARACLYSLEFCSVNGLLNIWCYKRRKKNSWIQRSRFKESSIMVENRKLTTSCVKVAGFQLQPQPSGTHTQSIIVGMSGSRQRQLHEIVIIVPLLRGLCPLSECLGGNLMRQQGKCEACLWNICGIHSIVLPTKEKKKQQQKTPTLSHCAWDNVLMMCFTSPSRRQTPEAVAKWSKETRTFISCPLGGRHKPCLR